MTKSILTILPIVFLLLLPSPLSAGDHDNYFDGYEEGYWDGSHGHGHWGGYSVSDYDEGYEDGYRSGKAEREDVEGADVDDALDVLEDDP